MIGIWEWINEFKKRIPFTNFEVNAIVLMTKMSKITTDKWQVDMPKIARILFVQLIKGVSFDFLWEGA